jgi:hypothetical protein
MELERGEGGLIWLLLLEVDDDDEVEGSREEEEVGREEVEVDGRFVEVECSSDCTIASTSSASNMVGARRSAPG